jgi:hypothetical protein
VSVLKSLIALQMSSIENKIPEELCQEFFKNSGKVFHSTEIERGNKQSFSVGDGKALSGKSRRIWVGRRNHRPLTLPPWLKTVLEKAG